MKKCKLIKKYKGYNIENCDGIVEVVGGDSRFIVALDDSKKSGSRKFIKNANNIKTAMKYIDWMVK